MIKTANSTPTGLPSLNLGSLSSSMQNSNTSFANTNAVLDPKMTPTTPAPTMVGPVAPAAPIAPAAPKTSIDSMYSPQTGVSTQKTADATYASNLLNSVTSGGSIPSSAITSGISGSNVSAKRDSYESMLQQYLDQQKDFQNRYLSALTPTQAEQDILNKLNQQNTQAALNQEIALNSGETSSFAGGEAQRVARTDAIKAAGLSAQLQALQGQREANVKQLQFLIESGDNSFKTRLEIDKLRNEVTGIDKQAQDTFFNLQQQNPDVEYTYDTTRTPVENLQEFRKQISSKPSELSLANRQSRINSIVSEFSSNPVVKRYQTVSEGYDFMKSLQDRLKSGQPLTSADNIGVLYAFAKIMDPDSAVREGEYDTIQKYAQSWSQAFGLKANRILNNEQFLTNEAINNLGSVIEAKYNSINKSFQNTQSEYNRKIEEAKLGSLGGSIVDYSKPFNQTNEIDFAEADKKALQTINPETGKFFTQEEIDAYKQSRGFNVVGGDTNQATRYDLTSGLGSMQGLLTTQDTVEPFANTGFGAMQGLMRASPSPQKSTIEIPKTSRLSFVNNNPGNLRFAGQEGASKGEGGFARFPSPEAGLRALEKQIKLDSSRGLTLSAFINKYAPPTENNTTQYLSQAIKNLGVQANTKLEDIPLSELTKFIALKESSTKVY